jgi:hypothetical protein
MNFLKKFFILTLLTVTAHTLMAVGRVANLVGETLDTTADIVTDPLDRNYREVVVVDDAYPYRRLNRRDDEIARLRAENRRLRSQTNR